MPRCSPFNSSGKYIFNCNIIFLFILNKVCVAASKPKGKETKLVLFCTIPTHLPWTVTQKNKTSFNNSIFFYFN